jgi:hypothetical protein
MDMGNYSAPRLRAVLAFSGSLALAATTLVAATPTAAASPTACRVKNLDTGVTKASLQKAHDAAKKGHRLTVRGVCAGPTTLRKSLTITGVRTTTSGKPILDGELSGTVVTVRPGVTVTLRGLTVRGGAAAGWGAGGISNSGRLVLRDVVARGNTAQYQAGGIYNGGTLVMGGSTAIVGNMAGPGDGEERSSGGGVVNRGTVVMNGASAIRGNSADDGAGVRNEGIFRMRDSSSVSSNSAAFCGGMENWSALTMQGSSSIIGNTAAGAGGVCNRGTVTMTDKSTIRANIGTTQIGGVMNQGVLEMRHSSTVRGNTSGSTGGGVWNGKEGSLVGVRCPMPGLAANVRNNMPDDCYPPVD